MQCTQNLSLQCENQISTCRHDRIDFHENLSDILWSKINVQPGNSGVNRPKCLATDELIQMLIQINPGRCISILRRGRVYPNNKIKIQDINLNVHFYRLRVSASVSSIYNLLLTSFHHGANTIYLISF